MEGIGICLGGFELKPVPTGKPHSHLLCIALALQCLFPKKGSSGATYFLADL